MHSLVAAAPEPDLWFERHVRELVVQADGTFVETLDDDLVIGPEGASGEAVQRALHWNASTGTIEIVEAATIKPDGTHIPAPPEMIVESTESERFGVFQDHRYRIVTYLDVEPGDRVRLRAVHRRTVPTFDRHFFDDRAAPERPALEATVIYDVPESMQLHFDAVGYLAEPVQRANGRHRHVWRHVGQVGPVDEPHGVSPGDYADRLNASTMPDYAALGHAYLEAARGRAEPTAAIRALAGRITRGAKTERERASALHRWVRDNVRYGGTHLGAATVVPKHAQATLDEREGDCKDQATLLEALLASVGIASSPVMVNATDAYRLPAVPTLGVFNHVINWVPSLGLFVDPTASHVRFGELPTTLSDKPALIVTTGLIARTPAQRPLVQSIRLHGAIDGEGVARFTLEDTARGWFAGTRRHFFELADESDLYRASQGMLFVSRLLGDAEVSSRGGSTDGEPIALVMRGEVFGMVSGSVPDTTVADTDSSLPSRSGSDSAPGASRPRLRALSSIGVGIAQALDDFHSRRTHTAPWVCMSMHVDEQAHWTLAPGLMPADLPGGLSIRGEGFSYESRFEMHGRQLRIWRSLRLDFEGNVCTPERFRIVQRLARDVLVDLANAAALRRDSSR